MTEYYHRTPEKQVEGPTLKKRDPNAKISHVEACLSPLSQYQRSTGFEGVILPNEPGAEISLHEISLETTFVDKKLKAPLMIAPMTGGTKLGQVLNERWAKAAEHFQIAMGVGSQRLALEDPSRSVYYSIRKHAPTALLFGNLGAGQLVQEGWGYDQVMRAIEMIEANAFFIHFNAMQEACQDGDVNLIGLLPKLEELAKKLRQRGFPLWVREVGFGFSAKAVKRLLETGISGIDCAGAGGTSWSRVEAMCAQTERQRAVAMTFAEWGISTADSIKNVRAVSRDISLIATGGIRNGLDVAKAMYLGANVASMAQPFLHTAHQGEEALFSFIEQVLGELRISMFASGLSAVSQFGKEPGENPKQSA